MKQTYEYRMGIDAAKNGSNTTNCHLSLFSTPEKMREWQKGYYFIKNQSNQQVTGAGTYTATLKLTTK
ncbi:hypothetical protein JYU20_00740 [Bacteroidales bacterium AH-315-I05]|nr:hypothetical protein [Bacteroidales bacterium AH-315-I05]